jgi:hypothetical protein
MCKGFANRSLRDFQMSVQVVVELSEDAFSSLRRTPEAFVKERRLAAAVKWYETGLITRGSLLDHDRLHRS